MSTDVRAKRVSADHPHYKWVALSNTTLGMLISTINSNVAFLDHAAFEAYLEQERKDLKELYESIKSN